MRYLVLHTILSMVSITLLAHNVKADWVSTNGPYGANAKTIEIMGNKTFVATFGGGIYFSDNNGNSWTESNSGISFMYLWSLGTCGGTVFTGTNGYGIFRSADSGATWNRANTGLTNHYIHSFATNGTTIYAGTSGGICRSTDGGVNWSSVDTAFNKVTFRQMAVDGNTIFAGTSDSGILRSTDNGTTWRFIRPRPEYPTSNIYEIATNGNTVFSGEGYSNCSVIYRSVDNGTTWSRVYGVDRVFTSSFTFIGNAVLAATSIGVLKSIDNGTTWFRSNAGLTDTIVQALKVNGSTIFAGTEFGGVFRSTNNGDNWTAVNTGITSASTKVWATDSNMLFAMVNSGGAFRSIDNGASWAPVTTSPGNLKFHSLMESGDTIFAGTDQGAFVSTDTGTHWIPVNSGIEKEAVKSLVKYGNEIFIGTPHGVFSSSNRGGSWTLVGLGSLYELNVTSLNTCGDAILAATYKHGVFRLTKNDTSWNVINIGLKDKSVSHLAVCGNKVLAGSFNGIFRSQDNGENWTDTIKSIGGVNSLLVLDSVILATGNGVYCSKDTGTNWTKVSTGLPTATANITISSLAVCGKDLFANVSSKSVWRRPLQEILSTPIVQVHQKIRNQVPFVIDIHTTFSRTVGIGISLTQTTRVLAAVCDLSGRKVALIVNQMLGSGEHSYTWDFSSMTQGCYMIRVRAGGSVVTRLIRVMD